MKFIAAMVVTLVTTLTAIAQDFKGYYITNNGNKVEGYFKDGNFNEVNTLVFKTGKMRKYDALNANDIKEYGIEGSHRYIKFTVKFDTTGVFDDNLTSQKDPEWKEEAVFLNVITETKDAVLYSYYNNGTRFFYSLNGKNPEQLVFRRYKDAVGKIEVNESYKEQLFTEFKCAKLTSAEYNMVSYTKSSLTDFFKKYVICKGVDANSITNYTNQYTRGLTAELSVYGGLRSDSFEVNDKDSPSDNGGNSNWGVGVEGAIRISDAFQLFTRLEYNKYQLETSGSRRHLQSTIIETYKYEGNGFAWHIGSRYNILLGAGGTKFYLDGAVALLMPSGSVNHTTTTITANNDVIVVDKPSKRTAASPTFNFGAGFMFANKIGVEARYSLPTNLLSDSDPKGKIGTLALNLRYVIL